MKQTFTFLIFFVPHILVAQNLAGVWKGFVTQGEGGYANRYTYELTIEQRNRTIFGTSHAYLDSVVVATLKFYGYVDKDSVRLSEDVRQVKTAITPTDWFICIKSLSLVYSQKDTTEFLRGSWTGYRRREWNDFDEAQYQRDKMCIPGEVHLVRTVKAPMIMTASAKKRLAKEMAEKKGITPQVAKVETAVLKIGGGPAPVKPIIPEEKRAPIQPINATPVFAPVFKKTSVKRTVELDVFNPIVFLEILDYERVDNDTVSVYHNRKALAERMRISKQKIRIPVNLDTVNPLNELLLTAENLGEVPPNTSVLTVIDGERKHRVMIESDLQNSCGIYLRYNPRKP